MRRRKKDAGNGRERVGGGEERDIDAGKETNSHIRPCISTPIRVIYERRNKTHHRHERKGRKERT